MLWVSCYLVPMFLYKIYQYFVNWYYGIENKEEENKEGGCGANKEKKVELKEKKEKIDGSSSAEVLETDVPAEEVDNKKVKWRDMKIANFNSVYQSMHFKWWNGT